MLKLYNADCLEFMNKIPAKSVDMILCDLPYGITKCEWDKPIDLKKLWKHYERIIKDNGAICLFGQTRFFLDLVNSNPRLYRYDLVWDKVLKTRFLNANKQPLRQHEQIAVFYKKQPKYNPQVKKLQTNYEKGENQKVTRVYGSVNRILDSNKNQEGKYPTSILKFKKVSSSKMMHPTEKPIELLEFLIRLYTDENDLVLDNCMGSGTTAVACRDTNRNFIGIEKDKDIFKIAKKRLEM